MLLQQIRDNSIKNIVLEKKNTHPKNLFTPWNKQRKCEAPDYVINLSSYKLSPRSCKISNNIWIQTQHHANICKIKIKTSIECQVKKVCIKENISPNYDMLHSLRNSTTKFVSESKNTCSTTKNRAIH